MAPHKFDLPDAHEWFNLCGLLTKRRVAEVETLESVCEGLGVAPVVAQYILNLISGHSVTEIGKHFVNSVGGPPISAKIIIDRVVI